MSNPPTDPNLLQRLSPDKDASSSEWGTFLLTGAYILIIIITVVELLYSKLGFIWTIASVVLLLVLGLLLVRLIAGPSSPAAPIDTAPTDAVSADAPSDDDVIRVVSRADLVDQYVGWTARKTNNLLKANLGKVLFVDEAYSILNGPRDEFGLEALTALNLFLSQHAGEIIVIFAGYRDLLQQGPFTAQPGLVRRFMWHFDCAGYTGAELYQVFIHQLARGGWKVQNEDEARSLIESSADAFTSYGGDTERLVFLSKLEYSRDLIGAAGSKNTKNVLTLSHLRRGLTKLRENNIANAVPNAPNQEAADWLGQLLGRPTTGLSK